MINPNLPLSPILQKRADQLPMAKEFYSAYLKLCQEYNAEVGGNAHGVECVYINGMSFGYLALI